MMKIIGSMHARDGIKTAKLTCVNDTIVGQYVRVVITASLQQIVYMMGDKSISAFSLVGDSSMHWYHSFFDLRL